MRAYDIIRRWFHKRPKSVLVELYKPIEHLWADEPINLMTQYMQVLRKYGKTYDVKRIHYHGVFPILDADRQYTPELYEEVQRDPRKAIKGANGQLAIIDYRRVIVQGYDEIWLFGGSYFGFYESRMIGRNAYWLNSPPLEMPIKPVIVMGFNYNRGLKEMVHNYCHRIESTMAHVMESSYIFRTYHDDWREPQNEWDKWVFYNGNTHNKRGHDPYTQDEFEWLKKFRWWWMV